MQQHWLLKKWLVLSGSTFGAIAARFSRVTKTAGEERLRQGCVARGGLCLSSPPRHPMEGFVLRCDRPQEETVALSLARSTVLVLTPRSLAVSLIPVPFVKRARILACLSLSMPRPL